MNAIVESANSDRSAYERLKRRHRRFVDHIVLGATGVDAIRAAGSHCKAPKFMALRWMRNPEIAAAIEERERLFIREIGVRTLRVMQETYAIATLDPRKLEDADGKAIPLHKLDEQTAAAIAAVDVENISINGETGTRYKYKFWDKNKALDKLGQYLKLWDSKTVNVDARRVTNNALMVQAGLPNVADWLGQFVNRPREASIEASMQDGPVLPASVHAEPSGPGE